MTLECLIIKLFFSSNKKNHNHKLILKFYFLSIIIKEILVELWEGDLKVLMSSIN